MPINSAQFNAVGEKINAVGNAHANMVDLYHKAKRRLEEGDFTQTLAQIETELITKYMAKRTALLAAVNALPEVN